MATGIPLPGAPGESLMKGLDLGSNMFSRIMQPILEREKQKQLAEQFGITNKRQAEQFAQRIALEKKAHEDNLAIQRMTQARLNSMAPLQRQALQLTIRKAEMETDPAKKMAYVNAIMQGIHGQYGQQSNQEETGVQPSQSMSLFGGKGMPSNEEMKNPTIQPPSPETIQQGLGFNFSPQEQMAMGLAGIKVPTYKENPEQKRYAELQNKIQLENLKNQQKIALEEEKNRLKNEQTRQKTIDTAQNDLPHLELTLDSLNKMEKIAKNNPEMWGHSGFFGFGAEGAADRYAKTSDNPNVGAFQAYLTGPIASGVKELSGRGSQLALKTMLGMKPNFSENQAPALGKIKAMKEIIKKQIEHTKKIAGVKDEGTFALMIDPETNETYKVPQSDVAMRTNEGWTHVK